SRGGGGGCPRRTIGIYGRERDQRLRRGECRCKGWGDGRRYAGGERQRRSQGRREGQRRAGCRGGAGRDGQCRRKSRCWRVDRGGIEQLRWGGGHAESLLGALTITGG